MMSLSPQETMLEIALILPLAQAQSTQQTTVAPGGSAPATQPKVDPPFPFGGSGQFWIIIFIILIFYLFLFRSKRGQDRQRTDMLAKMKKGDEVQTIGGVLGKVVETRDDRVLLKVDESSNTKVWFARSAIHRVLEAGKPEK
jgi:preprotein translocase subunit YajC